MFPGGKKMPRTKTVKTKEPQTGKPFTCSENTSQLIKAFFQTAHNCDLKVLSDDFCCRLLAWVSIFGGGREEVVLQSYLRESIFHARDRLNIKGGETPDAALLPILQEYMKEAESARDKKIDMPAWIIEIEKKYNLNHLD
jgi:hypothetical protein